MAIYLGDQEVGIYGLDNASSPESSSNYKGEWNAATEYKEGDIVRLYSWFYIAVKDNINVEVGATSTWKEITNSSEDYTHFRNSSSDQDMRMILTPVDDTNLGPIYGSLAEVPSENSPTINPSTGLMKVPGGIQNYVDYNYLSNRLDDYVPKYEQYLNQIISDRNSLLSIYFDSDNIMHFRHGNVVRTSSTGWNTYGLYYGEILADAVYGTNDNENSSPYYIFIDFDNDKLIGVLDDDLYVSSTQPENVTKTGSVWFVKSNRYFKVFDGTNWNNVIWSLPIARINYDRILNKFDTCGFMKDTAFINPTWYAVYCNNNEEEWINYDEGSNNNLIIFDLDKNNGCIDSDVYLNINTGSVYEDKLTTKIVYNPVDNSMYRTFRNNYGLTSVSKLRKGCVKVFRYMYYQTKNKNNVLDFQPYYPNGQKYFDVWNNIDMTCKYYNINEFNTSLERYTCPVNGELYVNGTSKISNARISVQIGYYNGAVTKTFSGTFNTNENFQWLIPVHKGDRIAFITSGIVDGVNQSLVMNTHYILGDYQLIFGGYGEFEK